MEYENVSVSKIIRKIKLIRIRILKPTNMSSLKP